MNTEVNKKSTEINANNGLADVAETRAIEFRAWDKLEQRMFEVYGLGIDFVTENTWDGVDESVNYFSGDDFKERIVIMQFTGLLDKNGRKIFEGDIVKYSLIHDSSEKIIQAKIEWFKHAWRLNRIWLLTEIDEIKVVGNIYEGMVCDSNVC